MPLDWNNEADLEEHSKVMDEVFRNFEQLYRSENRRGDDRGQRSIKIMTGPAGMKAFDRALRAEGKRMMKGRQSKRSIKRQKIYTGF